jgi:isocitrate/isopropylmalate dehydrogenase
MFEPIHGSAPKYAGQNVASPMGAIAAAAMMLEFIGEKPAAERVERAIASLLRSGRIPSVDARSGLRTNEIGDIVAQEVAAGRAE